MGLTLEAVVAWSKESQSEDAVRVAAALAERHGSSILFVPSPDDEDEMPVVQSVGDFLTSVGTPPPMLVQSLIPDQGLILVAGKPKHGKSYIVLDMLESIARGKKVFNTLDLSRPGPVLYVGMEDGPYEIANRLLKRGLKKGDSLPLYICTQRIALNTPSGIHKLRSLIEQVKPVLTVIDTAREGLGIRDWCDPAEVSNNIRPIRVLAREICPILMVAHNRKADGTFGDEIAGSNAFTSSVDGWISVNRKEVQENGNLRVWCYADGRGSIRGDYCLEMDTNSLHFRIITEEEQAADRKEKSEQNEEQRRAAIVEYLRSSGGATTVEISDGLALGYEVAKAVVRDLAKSKRIRDGGERGGPRGTAIIYVVDDAGISGSIPIKRPEIPTSHPFDAASAAAGERDE